MNQKYTNFWVDVSVGLLIFIITLTVYNATLTPSLSYKSPDGNEMATIPYILGLAHMTGYPLYTWLGKLFTYLPIGDVAHRMNLMSAVLGAGGVALLYLILRELTFDILGEKQWISRTSSLFSALLFGFSLTFWSQTGIAEVYAPNVLMFAFTLYLLLRWARSKESQEAVAIYWLGGFGLCYGLSLGTHMSNLGFAPGFALFILLIDWRLLIHPKEFITATLSFFLGILQFAWLPIKASTLNDAPMLRNAPNTLKGIYNYTLGAFPQLKFAFPFSAFPERIVIYLHLLRSQFYLPGIGFGIHGMTELLFRKPKRFFLLISMYLVQVIFFTQYRAFDLDVFFIPSHFIFVLFIGMSVFSLLQYTSTLIDNFKGFWRSISKGVAGILLGACLILPIGIELRTNWESNDYSTDVAINDFYNNVWELLPEDSVLIGRSGVFGYDMFYFRLVYDIRPDVTIPLLDNPKPNIGDLAGREIYSTTRLDQNQIMIGPGSVPPDLIAKESWHIPVLIGQSSQNFFGRGKELILYQISNQPPDLISADIYPEIETNQDINSRWRLIGVDLPDDPIAAGNKLDLVLYWQPIQSENNQKPIPVISTWLGEERLEIHQIGFGNLSRVINDTKTVQSGFVKESYSIVIPSTMEPGTYPFGISATDNYQSILDSDVNFSINISEINIQ